MLPSSRPPEITSKYGSWLSVRGDAYTKCLPVCIIDFPPSTIFEAPAIVAFLETLSIP